MKDRGRPSEVIGKTGTSGYLSRSSTSVLKKSQKAGTSQVAASSSTKK